MAWTTPLTKADNTLWTSAEWNTHVRDALNETMAAKGSFAGRWFVSTGANAIAERVISSTVVATSQTTTSTSYTDLTTTGPQITATTGTDAIVFWNCRMSNSNANTQCSASVAVSGASSIGASDNYRSLIDGLVANSATACNSFYKFTNLTAGSNTFTMKYKVGGGTGTFVDRELIVMPL